MSAKKSGKPSKKEVEFILKNISVLGLSSICAKLGRSEKTVKKVCLDNGVAYESEVTEDILSQGKASAQLRNSPEWQSLKDEFSSKELQYFTHRYSRVVSQFQDDVLSTEESQIFQLIKFEILMSRCLKDVKKLKIVRADKEKQITEILSLYDDTLLPDSERNKVYKLRGEVENLSTLENVKVDEYGKLHAKVSSILKELKATREQRINKIDNNKFDFISLIKRMADDKFRSQAGEELAFVQIAKEREKQRLSQYHTYIDGGLDKPLLSVETVEDDNNE